MFTVLCAGLVAIVAIAIVSFAYKKSKMVNDYTCA